MIFYDPSYRYCPLPFSRNPTFIKGRLLDCITQVNQNYTDPGIWNMVRKHIHHLANIHATNERFKMFPEKPEYTHDPKILLQWSRSLILSTLALQFLKYAKFKTHMVHKYLGVTIHQASFVTNDTYTADHFEDSIMESIVNSNLSILHNSSLFAAIYQEFLMSKNIKDPAIEWRVYPPGQGPQLLNTPYPDKIFNKDSQAFVGIAQSEEIFLDVCGCTQGSLKTSHAYNKEYA